MVKEAEFLIRICKSATMFIACNFETHAKGDYGDLVTSCDTAIERFLIKALNI